MPMKSSEKSPIRSSRKYLTQVLNNRKPTRKVKPLLFAVDFIPKFSIHVKYIFNLQLSSRHRLVFFLYILNIQPVVVKLQSRII